jgi:DNA-binding transcriptional LysR family regulator
MEQTNWRCVRQKVGKVLIRRSRQCEVLLYFSDFATNRDTIRLPSLVNAIREGVPRIKLDVSTWRTRAYEDVAAGRIDAALSAEEVPPALQSEIIRVDPR